jgi:hypothetical protein
MGDYAVSQYGGNGGHATECEYRGDSQLLLPGDLKAKYDGDGDAEKSDVGDGVYNAAFKADRMGIDALDLSRVFHLADVNERVARTEWGALECF